MFDIKKNYRDSINSVKLLLNEVKTKYNSIYDANQRLMDKEEYLTNKINEISNIRNNKGPKYLYILLETILTLIGAIISLNLTDNFIIFILMCGGVALGTSVVYSMINKIVNEIRIKRIFKGTNYSESDIYEKLEIVKSQILVNEEIIKNNEFIIDELNKKLNVLLELEPSVNYIEESKNNLLSIIETNNLCIPDDLTETLKLSKKCKKYTKN